MREGERLQEGIVVRHDNKGVWVGREVSATEPLTPEYTEHFVAGRRVFLAKGQAPILPAFLHPIRASRKRSRSKPKKKGK